MSAIELVIQHTERVGELSVSKIDAARSELAALRATVEAQARKLEEARKAIERCAAYIGSIDHGENTKSYMMCDAWLAANAPTPQTQPEQYIAVDDDRMFDE